MILCHVTIGRRMNRRQRGGRRASTVTADPQPQGSITRNTQPTTTQPTTSSTSQAVSRQPPATLTPTQKAYQGLSVSLARLDNTLTHVNKSMELLYLHHEKEKRLAVTMSTLYVPILSPSM